MIFEQETHQKMR